MQCEVIYGLAEIKQFSNFKDGRMYSYGYSIHRDRNGYEMSRTIPRVLSSIGFDNGTPFTEDDYSKIIDSKAITSRFTLTGKARRVLGKLKRFACFPGK